ncbi:conserved hypothetical protein [Candidatus Nitrospira nitrosa]|uniref:HTH luxR-type domain-containing protein n=1 Tax=Candidatus Nitrospira nitrosa TaxID=1742972 RepID=A0A0S4LQN4_9BACT|nr:helix-turn-helix transcriptional regulator [Candidatus Nitrospira nitrosa]CUS38986.1 conserved hypothetical protein [Candidatus Nitrospira nitrosa]
MERLSGNQVRQVSEFLLDLYQLRTHEEFTSHVIAALPKITDGEFTSYNEINHRHGLGTFQTDVPGFLKEPEHFGQVLAKEAEHHPILKYFQKTRDGSAVTLSDFVADREFRETVLSQEFYQPLQIPRIIGLALRIGSSHSVTLARHKNGREFGEHTRTTLNAIRPHLRQALENALAVTQMQHQLAVMNQAVVEGEQALISVTNEGRIRFITPSAQRLLKQYDLHTRPESDRLSTRLRDWLTDSERQLNRSDDVIPELRPLLVQGELGCLTIRLIVKDSHYLLMLEEGQAAPAAKVFEAFGLSTRESEILSWVSQGKTNSKIGMILGISRRTVQKHLERIYIKLGVENRTAAAMVASTTQSTDRS